MYRSCSTSQTYYASNHRFSGHEHLQVLAVEAQAAVADDEGRGGRPAPAPDELFEAGARWIINHPDQIFDIVHRKLRLPVNLPNNAEDPSRI